MTTQARAAAVAVVILAAVVISTAAAVVEPASAGDNAAAFLPAILQQLNPAPTPTRPADCEPAYPTVCLPSPPPDLDCPQIPYTNFPVLPADPHHLDADKDGIACEKP